MSAEGWHVEQIPAGKGGCEPVGHGVITESERGVSGGRVLAEDEAVDAERVDRSFRRCEWNERFLI